MAKASGGGFLGLGGGKKSAASASYCFKSSLI